ncbi:MAG: hypothetical protein ABIF12_02155 [bacterium]
MKKIILAFLISTISLNNTNLYSNEINLEEKQSSYYKDSIFKISQETITLLGKALATILTIEKKYESDEFQALVTQKTSELIQNDSNINFISKTITPIMTNFFLEQVDLKNGIETFFNALEDNKEFSISEVLNTILGLCLSEEEKTKINILDDEAIKLYSQNNNLLSQIIDPNYYTKEESINLIKTLIQAMVNKLFITETKNWTENELTLLNNIAEKILILSEKDDETAFISEDIQDILELITPKFSILIINEIKRKAQIENLQDEANITKTYSDILIKTAKTFINAYNSSQPESPSFNETKEQIQEDLLNSDTPEMFLKNLSKLYDEIPSKK